MTSAQDEFNELIRDKDRENRHPEDRHDDSDHSEKDSTGPDHYPEKQDTDDELDIPKDMRSNYYLPSIRSEANTGPKGVIADAHAFEKAKKQARRFTWRKSSPPNAYVSPFNDEKASSEDENEEGFLQKWREARLRELQNAGQRIRSRTTSPTRRIYGNLTAVDGEGFLEAIEKVPRDTVVVVFIYDDMVRVAIPDVFFNILTLRSHKYLASSRATCASLHSGMRQSASSGCTTRRRRWSPPAYLPCLPTATERSSQASYQLWTSCPRIPS